MTEHAWHAMPSGKLIDLLNFDESQVCLDDIAHNLAKVQRYNGGVPIDVTYSVAEHSMNLAHHAWRVLDLNKKDVAWFLVHDMSEAILADIPSAVKKLLPDYIKLEARIQGVISSKYLKQYDYDLYDLGFYDRLDKNIVLDEMNAINPDNYSVYEKAMPDRERIHAEIGYDGNPRAVKEGFLFWCEFFKIED